MQCFLEKFTQLQRILHDRRTGGRLEVSTHRYLIVSTSDWTSFSHLTHLKIVSREKNLTTHT